MRVIIGAHATHFPSSPSSDVALCGESGDPGDMIRDPSCPVCTTIHSRKMIHLTHGVPPPEGV